MTEDKLLNFQEGPELKRKFELIYSRSKELLDRSNYKILSIEDARTITDNLRGRGKKVVLISGVFDVLHVGHLALFEKAREYGEVLAVATPTDEQIQANKNPLRPITPLKDRLSTLSHIEDVDFTFPQGSWSTTELIKFVLPTVYVYTPWRNKEHMSKFIDEAKQFDVRLQQVDLDTSAISSSKLLSLIEKLR